MYQPTLITAWQCIRPADCRIYAHSHNAWELVYYLTGRGKTVIGTQKFDFSPGTFALIPPMIPHEEHHWAEGAVMCISYDRADPNRELLFCTDKNELIRSIARRLLEERRTQRPGYQDMLTVKLQELNLEIRRLCEPTPRTQKNLEYAVHFLEENYCHPIRMADLAAEYGYGYDYFHHRFRELTGFSPQQYLLRTRLAAAQRLLVDPAASCTQIALQCGFYGSAQFSQQFKMAFGCSPSVWRKQFRSASTDHSPQPEPAPASPATPTDPIRSDTDPDTSR